MIATLFAKLVAVVPLMAWPLVSNVAPPPVKEVMLFAMPPLKTRLEDEVTAVVLKLPVMETFPTKVSMPELLLSVKLPVPEVVPVMVRLFVFENVRVIPVITTLFAKLTAVEPVMAWLLVSKVAPPAENEVPLLVIPPRNTRLVDAATVDVNAPLRLTLPTKVSTPVLLLLVKLPVPVVVPLTVRFPAFSDESVMPVMTTF